MVTLKEKATNMAIFAWNQYTRLSDMAKKSCSVIAIYIMEDSLTNVNTAINFSAFPTLSDILKHQVILWNWEICTIQAFGSIKLTDSLIKCMPTFVQCY